MKKKKISMLLQIAILFAIGAVMIGVLLSNEVKNVSYDLFMLKQKENAESSAEDLAGYLESFPAHDWLIRYWYEHYNELDVEYEESYSADTVTARKYSLLLERNPGFIPEYAEIKDVEKLTEEDQKVYAEIEYSRLISRIDQIKETQDLSYVFGVVTEEPYDHQMVLFISANPGDIRGPEKGQVYPIGTELTVTEERLDAVLNAKQGEPQFSYNEDEKYFDYYYSLCSFGNHDVLIAISMYIPKVELPFDDSMAKLSLMTMGFMALLAAICLAMIIMIILLPLKEVQDNISLFKNTKDSSTVVENLSKIRSHNEIAELSSDFASMAVELNAYMIRNEETAVREEHNKTELALANRIQTAMLPNVFPAYPDRKDFDIYASMTPAREVGGDFFDFYLADDQHLCMVIADVSGKGVPAALYMMATKILLSQLIKASSSAAEILSEANNAICSKNPEEMFVTVWLGILDLETGVMTCANAGHEYPMLKKAGGQFELVKDKHSLVIGAMEGAQYQDYELRMDPGSSLFLYTDGLAEAVDKDSQMFGITRILEKLNTDPDRSPETILHDMKQAISYFTQSTEPFDDLTMMCVTYHGKG
ncbi:MAG: PP2C family protein-serine/threonine phosphatase [Erysipelotrichaceae bacterium]|nr:PP2C family protein-serine/threonine phosphatase [Erysipelotrichaceae bacterium]